MLALRPEQSGDIFEDSRDRGADKAVGSEADYENIEDGMSFLFSVDMDIVANAAGFAKVQIVGIGISVGFGVRVARRNRPRATGAAAPRSGPNGLTRVQARST